MAFNVQSYDMPVLRSRMKSLATRAWNKKYPDTITPVWFARQEELFMNRDGEHSVSFQAVLDGGNGACAVVDINLRTNKGRATVVNKGRKR